MTSADKRAEGRSPLLSGYICMLADPDGNMVEFSYDQGVYALASQLAQQQS